MGRRRCMCMLQEVAAKAGVSAMPTFQVYVVSVCCSGRLLYS